MANIKPEWEITSASTRDRLEAHGWRQLTHTTTASPYEFWCKRNIEGRDTTVLWYGGGRWIVHGTTACSKEFLSLVEEE